MHVAQESLSCPLTIQSSHHEVTENIKEYNKKDTANTAVRGKRDHFMRVYISMLSRSRLKLARESC